MYVKILGGFCVARQVGGSPFYHSHYTVLMPSNLRSPFAGGPRQYITSSILLGNAYGRLLALIRVADVWKLSAGKGASPWGWTAHRAENNSLLNVSCTGTCMMALMTCPLRKAWYACYVSIATVVMATLMMTQSIKVTHLHILAKYQVIPRSGSTWTRKWSHGCPVCSVHTSFMEKIS